MNQCIKTGADVYLTGEQVIVHGDLFVMLNGNGICLALHYVTPFKYKAIDYDVGKDPADFGLTAVFETKRLQEDREEIVQAGFLDIEAARVMVICPEGAALASYLCNPLVKMYSDANARYEAEKREAIRGAMGEILGSIGISIDGGDESDHHHNGINGAPLQ